MTNNFNVISLPWHEGNGFYNGHYDARIKFGEMVGDYEIYTNCRMCLPFGRLVIYDPNTGCSPKKEDFILEVKGKRASSHLEEVEVRQILEAIALAE